MYISSSISFVISYGKKYSKIFSLKSSGGDYHLVLRSTLTYLTIQGTFQKDGPGYGCLTIFCVVIQLYCGQRKRAA